MPFNQPNLSARLSRPFRVIGTGLAAVTLALGPVPAAAAGMATQDSGAVTAQEIDDLIRERMATHGIPGAAVAVVRGGEIVHLAGYGQADPAGRSVDPDTPFLIGSVSKPFTSLAIYQLIRDGVLSLEQPIAPLLADIVAAPGKGFEGVSVEHLLSHTSGLSMSDGLAGTVQVHRGADALQRRVQDIMSQPLRGEPGHTYVYSNAGAVLLAAIVEQVTGTAFADYLNDRVFSPLGMEGSFASEGQAAGKDLATGHRQWFGRWTPADLPYDSASVPNGYIGSTARDLAFFMQAHLSGEPAAVMPYTVDQIADGATLSTGWEVPLEGGHGTGWFVDEFAGLEGVVSHAGSLGHFTAHVIFAPAADDLGIAVLSNASAFVAAGHAGQYDLSLELARLLLGAEPDPTESGMLMTIVAPAAAWAGTIAILGAAVRFRRVGRRGWVRTALPSAAYVGAGVGILLLAPLAAARHFYPDVGWGLTATASFAIGWGALRAVLARPARRAASDGRSHPVAEESARV